MDSYIDSPEAVQYGRYFFLHIEPLIGASEVFNVEALRQKVRLKYQAIEAGMMVTNTPRSVVRTGRSAVDDASDDLLGRLRRFYHYLQSLPDEANVDVAAFFAGGKLGNLSQYKPEDMLDRGDAVVRGFAAPTSAGMPNAAEWQAEIVLSTETLTAAINDKLGAANTSSTATSSLARARQEFLHVYNKVAKPAIRGLLAELGREHELRLYFRDMQVNEGRPRTPATPAEPVADAATADPPSDITP